MLLKHIVISLLVFVSPVFPPAIIPFAYTLIWLRLVQWAGPVWLSLCTVLPAALSSILIRMLYGYFHKKILEFKKRKNHEDWISRIERKIAKYLENKKKISKFNNKIKNYLETKNNKLVLFLLTIVAIDSAIPDIIAIGIVRKKLPFRMFIIAVVIGKSTVYLPVILLGEGILILIKSWF